MKIFKTLTSSPKNNGHQKGKSYFKGVCLSYLATSYPSARAVETVHTTDWTVPLPQCGSVWEGNKVIRARAQIQRLVYQVHAVRRPRESARKRWPSPGQEEMLLKPLEPPGLLEKHFCGVSEPICVILQCSYRKITWYPSSQVQYIPSSLQPSATFS